MVLTSLSISEDEKKFVKGRGLKYKDVFNAGIIHLTECKERISKLERALDLYITEKENSKIDKESSQILSQLESEVKNE